MNAISEFISNNSSVFTIVISLLALYISLRNGRVQRASYQLTRSVHRTCADDFHVVSSEQLQDSVLVKLVYFNPGSISTIIQSLAVYEIPKSVWWFPRKLDFFRKSRVESAKWWPALSDDEKTTKLFADNFQYLIVKDCRVIFVTLPGMINRLDYAFELRTNHGSLVTVYALDFIERGFSFNSTRRFG
ncbi:hypothetical protein B7453_10450 [Pseudomonas sp. IB20]|uniref:hypothetical protein n=1 Tax=Pseudomonas sp. IB20 TaxID=1702250 RepID=UPI000BA039A6|nr:hypothetical protein [Pseudomonas sp. IB20]OZO04549.1 hypothetical protein B7453_10450 [Pseudomonas sp. IB20]